MRRGIAVAVGLFWLTGVAADETSAPDTIAGAFAGEDAAPELVARVFPVADLVVSPIPRTQPRPAAASEATPFPLAAPPPPTSPEQQALEHLAELSVILQSVIAPESWEAAGGPGHIAVHGQTLSLVVRQSPEVHEEIDALLTSLRRAADLEIEVVIERFFPHEEEDPDVRIDAKEKTRRLLASIRGPLDADQAQQLRQALRKTCEASEERLTLPNGWRTEGAVGPVLAVASGDHRSIRVQLQFHWMYGGEENLRSVSRRVPNGHSVAVPIQAPWTGEGDFEVLLLTARLLEVEEPLEPQLPPATVSGAPPLRLPDVAAAARGSGDGREPILPAPPSGSLPAASGNESEVQAGGGDEIQLVAGRRAARRQGRFLVPVRPTPEKCDPLHERKVLEGRETEPPPGAPPDVASAAPPAAPSPGASPAAPSPGAHSPRGDAEPPAPLREEEGERAQIAEAERRLRELLQQSLAEERERRLREQLPTPTPSPSEQPDSQASSGRERLPAESAADVEERLRSSQEQALRQLRELMARQRELLREAEPRRGVWREPLPEPPEAPVPAAPGLLRPVPPARDVEGSPPPGAEELERHILHAAEHLEAAGLPDLARQVREQARERLRERFEQRLREIEAQIERLRREAEAIRGRLPSGPSTEGIPYYPGDLQRLRREAGPAPDRPEPDRNRREPDPERRQPSPPAPPERPHPPPEKILFHPPGLPR